MQVTGMQHQTLIPHYNRTKSTKGEFSHSITLKNTDSANRSNFSSTISKLATQYENVSNISPPAMRELAEKLWEAGELSLMESGILIGTPIEVVRSKSGLIIETRPVQSTEYKFNYIAEIKGALEWAEMSHEQHKIKTLDRVLSVLNELNAVRNGGINITA
jgi:hypothetical protein